VLIARELAVVRGNGSAGAPVDEDNGLDAALAALTGKVTLGDGVSRPVEAVVADIWRAAGVVPEEDPGKA
jgi:MoxR-like ATPase